MNAMASTAGLLVPAASGWSLAGSVAAAARDRLAGVLELRIDVQHGADEIEAELGSLYGRLYTPGDILHGISAYETDLPGFVFRYRQADGEHYVYVEDVAGRRLAGYTVFNRLIEVGKRADRYVRAPHSKYAPEYQRRGLATAVYEWGLERGLCLITGARQSTGANALWHALARHYPLGYVDVRNRSLRYLGEAVSQSVHDDLHTRMILIGKGWSVERLVSQAMRPPAVKRAPRWFVLGPRAVRNSARSSHRNA